MAQALSGDSLIGERRLAIEAIFGEYEYYMFYE
jgi:hypothetical protein